MNVFAATDQEALRNIFAAPESQGGERIESVGELVAYLSNPYADTVCKGLEIFTGTMKPVAWDAEIPSPFCVIMKQYMEEHPDLAHFVKLLERVEREDFERIDLALNSVRLLIYFSRREHHSSTNKLSQTVFNMKKTLFRIMHSGNHNNLASVLALLSACAGSRSGTDSVKEMFDFGMKPLEKILFMTRKLSDGSDRTMYSLRQVYIDFVLTLLLHGSYETRDSIAKMRLLFANIFKLLPKDHPVFRRHVLYILKQVIVDEQHGYAMAVSVFSALNLYQVVQINESESDSNKWTDYLHALTTKPGQGVCFVSERGNPQLLKNRINLDLLFMLKPTESAMQQDLAIAILNACPDCIIPYLEKQKIANLLVEVQDKQKWTAGMALLIRIFQIDTGAVDVEDVGFLNDFSLLKHCPTKTSLQKHLLVKDDPVVVVYTVTLMFNMACRVRKLLEHCERSNAVLQEREDLLRLFTNSLPDHATLFQVFETWRQATGELDVLIKSRLAQFLAHYLRLSGSSLASSKLSKADLINDLKNSGESSVGELAVGYISLAVELPGEKWTFDDISFIPQTVCLNSLFLFLLCRFGNVKEDKRLPAIAEWANSNRQVFFKLLEAKSTFDFVSLGIGKAEADTTRTDNQPANQRKKRKQEMVSEWTVRGIFTYFGRDYVQRLVNTFSLVPLPADDNIMDIEDMESASIVPWLRLIASDLNTIDASFCALQLPIVLVGTASEDPNVRSCSYALLDRVYQFVCDDDGKEGDDMTDQSKPDFNVDTNSQNANTRNSNNEKFKERRQVRFLVKALKNSTDVYMEQQPLARVLFCAHVTPYLVSNPSNPLYLIINEMLTRRPWLPRAGIPHFDDFLLDDDDGKGHDKRVRIAAFKLLKRIWTGCRTCVLPDWQLTRLYLNDLLYHEG